MKTLVWSLVVALHLVAFFALQGCGTRRGTTPPQPVPMPPRVYTQPEEQSATLVKPSVPSQAVEVEELDFVDLKEYTVQKGDSISLIAQRYKVTVGEIVELNKLKDKDVIWIGQKLKMPSRVDISKVAEPAEDKAKVASAIASGDIYVVQPNDCLSTIAYNFKTTVKEIIEINNLSSDVIRIGQKLKIPKSASTPTTQVRPVVTPVKPEPKVETKPVQIEQEKPVQPADPVIEEQTAPPVTTTVFEEDQAAFSQISHTVDEGDTLESIRNSYSVPTVEEIAELNGISVDAELAPGMIIKVPL